MAKLSMPYHISTTTIIRKIPNFYNIRSTENCNRKVTIRFYNYVLLQLTVKSLDLIFFDIFVQSHLKHIKPIFNFPLKENLIADFVLHIAIIKMKFNINTIVSCEL